MKTLCLSTDLMAQIRRHCADSYPQEACGLLLGREDGVVINIAPSPNLSVQPGTSFEIDPALIIAHQKQARKDPEKIRILGHYHSHPDGQAHPSARDQVQNYDVNLVWLIVAVTEGVAETMTAFATDPKSGQLKAIPLIQFQQAGKI